VQYPPVTASITLDTVPPITSASPIPGTYAAAPVTVSLAANEAATTYYTTDGTTPTTASAVYSTPLSLGTSTTIKYFSVDTAGNVETVNTASWDIHTPDLVASVAINNGATRTNSTGVTLSLSATDPSGVATMQFSNDGITYTAEEPYTTGKAWTLTPGDGLKTVYVRFRDNSGGGGFLYGPFITSITMDTVPPLTTASPIPGIYVPTNVTLTASESSTIYYTLDGSTPTTASTVYTGPISIANTTTITYFAVDIAGNAEAVKSGTWTIPAADLVASVTINNGQAIINKNIPVTLTLSASDPMGIATMQFSNDGVNFTTEETYAATKQWALSPGDGLKTVYVRFRDNTPGGGALYPAVTAGIVVDTVAPVSTPSPIPGIYSASPGSITIAANEQSTIYYTIDGTTPTTASAVYSGPIPVSATTTIQYFAIDVAGNIEAVKTGVWTISTADMSASVFINSGAALTNSTAVNLALSATDPAGVATMQFSNDGISYTAEEPYATAKNWTLTPGDGAKTVYVRFRDASLPTGKLYDPATATIVLDTTAPVSTASPIQGTYSVVPVPVVLTANEPAVIYYTLDGTAPSTSSAVYSAPIPVSTTTTVRYHGQVLRR
jgi:hypothetical protein